MAARRMFAAVIACSMAAFGVTCSDDGASELAEPASVIGGKADEFRSGRQYEVILTDPHCDVCTPADKNNLLARSKTIGKVIELIEGAEKSVEVAQFTFSRREIEAALLAARDRGIDVRVAMNEAQNKPGTVATRLEEAGINVRFVHGRDNGSFFGLQHAKFMVVDDSRLWMGSNNWSSTGTSLNEENSIVVSSRQDDPLLASFNCYYELIWDSKADVASQCNSDEVAFTPSTGPSKRIRDRIRAAEKSVDVLMHHLVFEDSVKELANAAGRGVRVRVIVNAADRGEIKGRRWDSFFANGGEIRFKQGNAEMFQLMHHKLGIVDGKILLNGSGNWSGSAFFNNFEFYTDLEDPRVVQPFNQLYARLWQWSLSPESLDAGLTAAQQDARLRTPYFGTLHAHFHLEDADGRVHDDGKPQRGVDGKLVDVSAEIGDDPMRHAFEYARDEGKLDFIALTPHTLDRLPNESIAAMTDESYAELVGTAAAVTTESGGTFVALPGMEWSTNSSGNHVNILGSRGLATMERGNFTLLYEGFLPVREEEGDQPILMFNHPRTFRRQSASLGGNWDQIFDLPLTDIPNESQRSKKFNDYGLDEYGPVAQLRESWIAGDAMPDAELVAQSIAEIERVSRPYARLMEVLVGRGTELNGTEAVNPSISADFETQEPVRFTKVHVDYDYYLLNGFQLAPVANHDNHFANWGRGATSRTVVFAEQLSEDSLLDAVRSRMVAASEDENMSVRLYAEGRVPAGSQLGTIEDQVTLSLQVSDFDTPGPFVVKPWLGTVGHRAAAPQDEHSVPADAWQDIEVAVPNKGRHFVYLEVHELAKDRMYWTAPIFIERH